MSFAAFEEFLRKVTSKVKSKGAHGMIKKELHSHLVELSQSFQKRDSSKEEADKKAIKEMGNPFTIGENLNRLHKPRMDWILIALFLIIAGISFLPLVGGIEEVFESSLYFMQRHAIWYTLATFVILGFLFFDYRKLKNLWMFFYGSGLLILLYTYSFGITINGAARWMAFGGFHVDVTITLFLFFLAWAGIMNKINEFNRVKKQVLLFFLFWTPIFFYMLLPHFMLSIIYFCYVLTMFAFSQVPKKFAMKLATPFLTVGIVFIIIITLTFRGTYLFHRLFAFINPSANPNEEGYMYIVVRDILSQAGWFGNGLYTQTGSLPFAHTDFAFPYLVYSLGWLFGISLCLLLLIFISRIALNAFKTKDLYGRLLVIGGATIISVPAFWNILMGFGIVPIMAVSLPFISYGGSMLFFYSAILGLILNVYRRKDIVEPTIVKL
ncbi:FtsW/RodA/SpoVE family cell cycle protein [Salipaludibacillus sp. HK11]|uniref:FtsW/RodA/SpoVE family cell cycle protein n=1 Tax=Salipaludibacillus sp. HK11 TaxID=3394320 RepID=UPI0039FBEE90